MRNKGRLLEHQYSRLVAELPSHLADLAQRDFGVLTTNLPEADRRRVGRLRKLSKQLAGAQV